MGDLPPWLGDQRRSNNRKSREYERRVSREVGGRTTAGSGSSWRSPEDVRSDTHLIQHKFTRADSIRITRRGLNQLAANANRAGKDAAYIVEFERSDGPNERWVITPYDGRGEGAEVAARSGDDGPPLLGRADD